MSPTINKFIILTILMSSLTANVQQLFAEDKHNHAEMTTQRSDIYYCPMHPQIISDKPGECPICHMRLVLRDTNAQSAVAQKSGSKSQMPEGYSTVYIQPERQQLISIRIGEAQKKQLYRQLSVPARVAYDPELYNAQIKYLEEYRISLGTLRNRELEFKNLYDSRWAAPRVEIAKSKLVLMGMDDAAIEELIKSAKADDSLLYLKPDAPIWVYAYIFESDLPWVHRHDKVILESPSLPGRKYEGEIHSIGSMVDPETRRVHMHIRLQNDGFLKPEMFFNATIVSSIGETLSVPAEAVFFTGKKQIVFVDKGEGIFEPRQVQTGAQAGQDYEILSGLDENERVALNGNFLLDSESRLQASLEKSIALQSHHEVKNVD